MSTMMLRGVVGLLVGTAALAAAVVVPTAHAGEATLWGCHGPAGQALGSGPFAASATGDGVAAPYAGGCDAAAGALDDGGLRAAFTRADPAAGSAARWQVALPQGVAVSQVELVRRTSGFGGPAVPGGAQGYLAETASGPLEAGSVEDADGAPRDGAATFPTTGGGFVRFGLSCAAPAPQRCAAPSATPLAVDVGAVAVRVSDVDAPRGAVGGVSTPASGTLALTVRAADVGLGLARAEARVDGVVAAATDLGGPGCADLSPGAAAVDLPLGDGCPSAVEDLRLPVATPLLSDGVHRLQVGVTDAAGNGAVLVDQDVTVDNSAREQHSTVTLTLGTSDSGGAGGAGGGGPGGSGSGGVGGAGGPTTGGGPTCRAPRLSMFLKDKPLRLSKGRPVLRRNARYRFTGTLTCASNGRRVRAPAGVVVALRALIGKKTYKKHGVATRAGGALTFVLASPTSRLLEFRYTSVDRTTTRVRIRIVVSAKGKTTKKKADR